MRAPGGAGRRARSSERGSPVQMDVNEISGRAETIGPRGPAERWDERTEDRTSGQTEKKTMRILVDPRKTYGAATLFSVALCGYLSKNEERRDRRLHDCNSLNVRQCHSLWSHRVEPHKNSQERWKEFL